MLHNLTGWHALVVLAIVLLVFGSTKLPSLAKGVGQSMRILKDEVHEDKAKTSATPDDVSVPVPYRHAS
ncbi:twin-arginine translocase TatA/TatE family subunit [Rhodococcus fascians]|jgi:sec-independent protein translocase protein TatA|uniref:twin-arginine translocase TatA/TatE family subunit n=1 Tax=Nocardiaceae TaxID=85025 RepID=UPI00050C0F83|nr:MULTISPECIES: twin-arginine translocase TatA/TatE family subunit [Rhodococcus]MBY4207213.1 twin-arginine translocase TatA/TatE family subunit [Rhodococcus fascians]OZD58637.1 Sec-independent protein translocase TatA [Rhodococcus sp. 06-1477-1B]MBY4210245.1 twin-arginine translocase TatA/TatE family subunit [Rhodococcus fascians]MBY4235604.1 twin-arginine translocase TatA/TatE family subunit [Rhodococcus fascians]MBY4251295.1 twin-arginine translocase TatA/TatE family subunit [Rhodococcus fa